jgi:hypothetical protein
LRCVLDVRTEKTLLRSGGGGVSAAAWTWGFAKSRRSPLERAGDMSEGARSSAVAGSELNGREILRRKRYV